MYIKYLIILDVLSLVLLSFFVISNHYITTKQLSQQIKNNLLYPRATYRYFKLTNSYIYYYSVINIVIYYIYLNN